MPDLNRDDVTIHFEVEGSGPPLLLLAGMLSDSATWAGFAPLLTDSYTVIRPDNRTTGRTVPWDAPTNMNLMAHDALAVMAKLGFERFHVAGHSMGGLLAMELAVLAPEQVATASVFASGRVRMPRTIAAFDALLAVRRGALGEELWLRALYPWVFGQAFFESADNVEIALEAALAYPYAQTADAMAHQIEAFRSLRPSAKPENIACPTLVAYAGADILVPPALAKSGFATIPNLQEVTIDTAGHSIVWDAPDLLSDHLRRFLAAHPID
ncbi:MAG: alpha/beta hydrolase [Sulfitobacter sp.]